MGWSLKGILQGAAAGAADWAVRGQAADLQAERDAAQFERSKEMARYNDELGGARSERMAELQQKFKDKADTREAESVAENNTLASEYAAEGGAKPGSKEWHVRKAEFLGNSGRTAMAKGERDIAEKYDDNEIRREQNAASLANSAATRFAAAEQRAITNDLKTAEREDKLEKEFNDIRSGLGTLKLKDKLSGDDIVDMSGVPVLTQLDKHLRTDYGMKDRQDRIGVYAQVRTDADIIRKANPKYTVGDSLRVAGNNWAKNNPPPVKK